MKLRNVFFTSIACSVLVFAAGNNNNNNDMYDTSDQGSNGSMMDTMVLSGTIQQYNEKDSMLILESETATDTLYISEISQIPPKDQLKKGTSINARYIIQGDRKIVVSIETAEPTSYKTSGKTNGSNGSRNGEKMINGTIEQFNRTDSMLVIRSDSDDDRDTVYFDKNTKMNKDDIKKGEQVDIKYKKMDDKKVATKITKSAANRKQ